jgi:hypothetical protein
MAKPKRSRTDRREAERTQEKLAGQREKLFALEAGGSAGHPREVVSASLVEPEARSVRCPRCDGELSVVEHLAHTVDGTRLREAKLRCRQCGSQRSRWFKIVSKDPN